MGCDIHGYIESQPFKDSNPKYWYVNADISIMRDYAMFGLLAGVRGGDDPLFAPRGWDENSATKYEFCLRISDDELDDEHSCTRDRATEWIERGCSKPVSKNLITHPDWHTPSWLTAEEYETVLSTYKEKYPERNANEWEAILAFMKCIPDSRFTFWFDN